MTNIVHIKLTIIGIEQKIDSFRNWLNNTGTNWKSLFEMFNNIQSEFPYLIFVFENYSLDNNKNRIIVINNNGYK